MKKGLLITGVIGFILLTSTVFAKQIKPSNFNSNNYNYCDGNHSGCNDCKHCLKNTRRLNNESHCNKHHRHHN